MNVDWLTSGQAKPSESQAKVNKAQSKISSARTYKLEKTGDKAKQKENEAL